MASGATTTGTQCARYSWTPNSTLASYFDVTLSRRRGGVVRRGPPESRKAAKIHQLMKKLNRKQTGQLDPECNFGILLRRDPESQGGSSQAWASRISKGSLQRRSLGRLAFAPQMAPENAQDLHNFSITFYGNFSITRSITRW